MSVTHSNEYISYHIAAHIEELMKHRHQLAIAVDRYIRKMHTKTTLADIYELVKKKGSDSAFVEELEAMIEHNTISQNESSGLDMGTRNPPIDSSPLANTNTEEIYAARR